jgi:uncharacterized alpha-E superfamily protein
MARFVERAENLARILDVNETFSRDSRGAQNWLSIIQINADDRRFFAKHDTVTSANVLAFYVTDADNPTSILSAVKNARENARTLRPLISTEMWTQLNIFYNRLRSLDPKELTPGSLTALFASIKEACQTHTGITEGTFFRDQGWYFYQLGRYIERADQTTRLVDIKYHLLLPRNADVGSPVDVSQWNTLLRSAAGYHAYRRVHTRGIDPAGVSGFLLLSDQFPRSVAYCVHQADHLLFELKSRYILRGGNEAAECLDEVRAVLASNNIDGILTSGLHEFVDWVQLRLVAITTHLSDAFFGRPPQQQSQALAGTP